MSATGQAGEEKRFRIIGTRPIRHDGIDKVTGRAKYGADLRLAGELHGKVLRSPHAHARIVRIDASRAAAAPGVKAVVTGADMPEIAPGFEMAGEMPVSFRDLSDNVLAKTTTLYEGHAVAAVAATNPHVAEQALALIDVEYEVLPPVMDLRTATAPGATILHPAMRTQGVKDGDEPTNVASRFRFERGDVEGGLAAADVVVEREFATSAVHQGYIEPPNALAKVDADGQVTIWCSTQGPFDVRGMVARVLELSLSKVRVIPAEIGGGFGGKTTSTYPDERMELSARPRLPSCPRVRCRGRARSPGAATVHIQAGDIASWLARSSSPRNPSRWVTPTKSPTRFPIRSSTR